MKIHTARLIPLILNLNLLLSPAAASARQTTGSVDAPVITVTGKAERTVERNQVGIRFEVRIMGPSIEVVREEHNQKAREVLATLEEMGIPRRDCSTTSLQVDEDRPFSFREPADPARRYFALQRIDVLLRQLSAVDSLITRVMEAGATSVSNLEYSYSDLDSLQRELRKEAVQDARRRAGDIADALGMRIVGVELVGDDNTTDWRRFMMEVTGAKQSYTIEEMERMAVLHTSTFLMVQSTAPGTQRVSAEVRVAFRMGPRPPEDR